MSDPTLPQEEKMASLDLEEVSDKIRMGTPVSILEAIAAIQYQEAQREQSWWHKLHWRWQSFCRKVRCDWCLFWSLCPACNSDAPRCDRCSTCRGSREFPLSAKTKERYRNSFHNDYDYD